MVFRILRSCSSLVPSASLTWTRRFATASPLADSTDSKLKKSKGLSDKQKEIAEKKKMTKKEVAIWNGIKAFELANNLNQDFNSVKYAIHKVFAEQGQKSKAIRKDTQLGLDLAKGVLKLCECKPTVINKNDAAEAAKPSTAKPESVKKPAAAAQPLTRRPPVVSILGHVDHGKTTLLDALRSSRVVDTEFGGITQHTGCFSVKLPDTGDVITFLDTPGHAAFSEMRARGAQLTDIVILVVAADDGVMPQTRESINHALSAKVPMVVAINKCDAPMANPAKVREQLAAIGVVCEELGGTVQMVEISALKGVGLQPLQEAVMTQAEILELEAPLAGRVQAAVVESRVDTTGRGIIATVLVQSGTLRKGDCFVADKATCRVRGMLNDSGRPVLSATPGQAVDVMGFRQTPSAGDVLEQVASEKIAKKMVKDKEEAEKVAKSEEDWVLYEEKEKRWKEAHRDLKVRVVEAAKLAAKGKKSGSMSRVAVFRAKRRIRLERDVKTGGEATGEEEETPKLSIILRADVDGSLEAILNMLGSYTSQQCELDLVNFDVGPPTESDLELAKTFGASLYCFNVDVPQNLRSAIKVHEIPLHEVNIIYRLAEQLREELQSKLPDVIEEREVGAADVLQLFSITLESGGGKKKQKVPVLGCRCIRGELRKNGVYYQWIRDGQVLFEGECDSLRHKKSVVDTIKRGMECGILLSEMDLENESVQPDDQLLCLNTVQVPQVIEWENPF